MSDHENPIKERAPAQTMSALLKVKLDEGDFYLEDGENKETIIDRCELLERVLDKLDQIAPQVVSTYRNILEENGISAEQTGKLSWVVVGGRVHGESQLKVNSDIDTIFTAEKPFLYERRLHLSEDEQAELPEEITKTTLRAIRHSLREALILDIFPRLSEMIGRDLEEEKYSVIEIKGYGHQRNQDVKNGLVIFTEQ
jgi:hypothetical protein